MIKQPWLAVFLSNLFPGAGQIYAGSKSKGIFFIVLGCSLFLITAAGLCLFIFTDDASLSRMYGFIGLIAGIIATIFGIYALFDAYKTAKNYNAEHALNLEAVKKKPWLAVFLSNIFPGIGQFYNRQMLKGILFIICALLLYVVVGLYYALFFFLVPFYLFAMKDAFESSEKINGSDNKFFDQGKKFVKIFVILLLVIKFIPYSDIIKADIVQAFKIPAASMLPTMKIGDHILVDKTSRANNSIKRGDIIVFKYPEDPERDFVKRVIAVGGDTIESKDKTIYINSVVIEEKYIQHVDNAIRSDESDKRDNFGPIKVPEDNYFVMGDNRDQSYDSRYWGFVPKENIKGKAFKIYWSWDSATSNVRWERIGEKLQSRNTALLFW